MNYNESMTDQRDVDKATQVAAVTNAWTDAVKAMGQALNNPDRLGLGTTGEAQPPYKTVSGTYYEQKVYKLGCDIVTVIDSEDGMVSLVLDNAGEKRFVEISRTPDSLDPRKGGSAIKDAERPGDYLLFVRRALREQGTTTRYLDKADIDGVLAEKGKKLTFKDNPDRGKRIVIQGTVTQVVRYRNRS
jgi:hypothetical protein